MFLRYFVLDQFLGDLRFETIGLVMLLYLLKIQRLNYVLYPQTFKNTKSIFKKIPTDIHPLKRLSAMFLC